LPGCGNSELARRTVWPSQMQNGATADDPPAKFSEEVYGTYQARVVLPSFCLYHWACQFRSDELAVVGPQVFRRVVMPLYTKTLAQVKALNQASASNQRDERFVKCKIRHVPGVEAGAEIRPSLRITSPADGCKLHETMQRLFPHRSVRYLLVVVDLGEANFSILLSAQHRSLEWISVVDGMFIDPVDGRSRNSGQNECNKRYFQDLALWLGMFMLSVRCTQREALSTEFLKTADPRHCTQVSMFWLDQRLREGHSILSAKLGTTQQRLDAFIEQFK
jgi:hypothetical protein